MSSAVEPVDLPLFGAPCERADAARNRRRILSAAERLFARYGVSGTSMDAIAAEAGVGKGTLFRRFGDRASLAFALLQASERDFQEAFIRGPAPLGPGAPPLERMIAFGTALQNRVAVHGDLMVAGPERRFEIGAYSAYRTHLTMLIRDADPALDAEYTAETLLSTLSADVVLYELRVRGMTLERLSAGWESLVRRLLSSSTGHP
jgi:AcrR family transcriptional regulator